MSTLWHSKYRKRVWISFQEGKLACCSRKFITGPFFPLLDPALCISGLIDAVCTRLSHYDSDCDARRWSCTNQSAYAASCCIMLHHAHEAEVQGTPKSLRLQGSAAAPCSTPANMIYDLTAHSILEADARICPAWRAICMRRCVGPPECCKCTRALYRPIPVGTVTAFGFKMAVPRGDRK